MIRLIFILLSVCVTIPLRAQPVQTIRGHIVDNASNAPVSFATVAVFNTTENKHVIADSSGNFALKVAVGRYELKVTSNGYEPQMVNELLIGSGKEVVVTISLVQKIQQLGEVIIKPAVNKNRSRNSMALVSSRTFNVEEAKRYAGGFDDPARLAASFAGVASNTNDNGIMVRGNAPKFLQWKMEGIEIPNPNHFADLKVIGGGTLTALSSQMLGNSDFFTGAFSPEYNNALSGIFDMNMRIGNTKKREHTFQLGVVGIDASSEGPFVTGRKSSYLFNYRYSTLALLQGLLPDNADGLRYQDGSFKLNFPTNHLGTFTVWGLGFIDKASAKAKEDSLQWHYYNDKQEDNIKLNSFSTGVSHKYFFPKNLHIKTTLAATTNNTTWSTKRLTPELRLNSYSYIKSNNSNFILSSFANKKFGAKHSNKTGILITAMNYDLHLDRSIDNTTPPKNIVTAKGSSTLISAYSNSLFTPTERLSISAGVNSQFFTLNNRYTIEPRIGIRQQINNNHSIAFAYGLHSRIEKLNYYLNNNLLTGDKAVNKNLDFTKAHHFVLSYNCSFGAYHHLKIEPYYQYLYAVPVIADSSFSLLNLQDDWFFAEQLVSTGKSSNYGVDVTFEKYMSQGFYYLATISVFNSRYRGGDGIWRNTRFNRSYVLNLLAGKEWQTGNKKQNLFSLNARILWQGGNRYSPINTGASFTAQDVVYDEQNAFSMQAKPSLYLHFTGSYKINRKKVAHEFSLKILNITGQEDFYGYKYNLIGNSIDKDVSVAVIPNISYKVEF